MKTLVVHCYPGFRRITALLPFSWLMITTISFTSFILFLCGYLSASWREKYSFPVTKSPSHPDMKRLTPFNGSLISCRRDLGYTIFEHYAWKSGTTILFFLSLVNVFIKRLSVGHIISLTEPWMSLLSDVEMSKKLGNRKSQQSLNPSPFLPPSFLPACLLPSSLPSSMLLLPIFPPSFLLPPSFLYQPSLLPLPTHPPSPSYLLSPTHAQPQSALQGINYIRHGEWQWARSVWNMTHDSQNTYPSHII